MQYFLWSDKISMGVDEIDEQHKYLILALNELGSAIASNASTEVVLTILYKMQEYTIYHFDAEEELMQKYNYSTPLMNDHINEHNDFIAEVDYILIRIAEKKGPVATEVHGFLANWLFFHIMNTDMLLAEAIKAAGE